MDRHRQPRRPAADRRARRRDHRHRVRAVPRRPAGRSASAATTTRCSRAPSSSSTAYFARDLKEFDLPLAPRGSAFQQQVWDQLRLIGYGETASYGEIAHRLGRTNAASRAVGLANGQNPIPIVIPCHRVIGANGTLTGYAGGLERKQTAARPRAGGAVLSADGTGEPLWYAAYGSNLDPDRFALLPAGRLPARRHPDLPGHPCRGRRRSTSGRSRCRAGWCSRGTARRGAARSPSTTRPAHGRGAQHRLPAAAGDVLRRRRAGDVARARRRPRPDRGAGQRPAGARPRALRDAPPHRRARRPAGRDVQRRRPGGARAGRARARRTSPRWRAACAAATGSADDEIVDYLLGAAGIGADRSSLARSVSGPSVR